MQHDPEQSEPTQSEPTQSEPTQSELEVLESFATSDLALIGEDPDTFFHEAAVLKGNALGIIYEGDGSTNAEKVQRLLMLIPALLTVVDEARDTISRLRGAEDDGERENGD